MDHFPTFAPAGERPITPDLFENGANGPYLIGGRRKSDGKIAFPLPAGAARDSYERIALSQKGLLWSWTIQRFRPKTPPYAGIEDEAGFRPFAVGYVEIPGEIIVEARLDADFNTLEIGMKMELATIAISTDPDGKSVTTYAFRPYNIPRPETAR